MTASTNLAMSSKNDSSPIRTGFGNMPYIITASGVNNQGNHYCNRYYGPFVANPHSYHYSNLNGSYYYSNPNGSTYYNDGKGYSKYTPPNPSTPPSTSSK
ncbi:hypothetical protein PRZ48_008702 [Zasmidium cellare]|uniref:Uncharacterized protein n=1 Tax=Zasmidium cellare TaxID=395010 RepID=A0ABR0EHG9_ZASCE|nr:hypothetical protein PRZ48_008702 [Zasmidium cellare]